MTRPGPLLWLRYAFLGSLPAQYSEWVLHDVTTGTWFVRYVARVLVMITIPEVALVLLVPASGPLRALTAFVTGACVVLLMSIVNNDVLERIVQRAGYEWGTAERVRADRSVREQNERAAAYRKRRERRRSIRPGGR